MTSALAPTPYTDPEVAAAMVVFERIQPLQDALGLKDLTPSEMQLFAMVAHRTGLDPFSKQIYAIKRAGKVTHQTGIDGYRSVAERTQQYAGSDEATYEMCECGADESPAVHPAVARVIVHRILPSGHVVHQTGVARWHELKPKHFKPQGAYGFLDDMWWQMPFNQLAKCAEANGLRKAFPRVLGDVYISDEMQQADAPSAAAEAEARRINALPSAADRLAARRQSIEATTTPGELGPGTAGSRTPAPVADATPSGEGELATDSPSAAAAPPLTPEQAAVQGEVIGDTAAGLTWQQFRSRMARANSTTGRVKAAAAELWPDRSLSPLPSEWALESADWAALATHLSI